MPRHARLTIICFALRFPRNHRKSRFNFCHHHHLESHQQDPFLPPNKGQRATPRRRSREKKKKRGSSVSSEVLLLRLSTLSALVHLASLIAYIQPKPISSYLPSAAVAAPSPTLTPTRAQTPVTLCVKIEALDSLPEKEKVQGGKGNK